MGWVTEEGYYEKHVGGKGRKITEEQEKFNRLGKDEIREGISILTSQRAKEKGIEEDAGYEKDEKIEYVIEVEDEELDR